MKKKITSSTIEPESERRKASPLPIQFSAIARRFVDQTGRYIIAMAIVAVIEILFLIDGVKNWLSGKEDNPVYIGFYACGAFLCIVLILIFAFLSIRKTKNRQYIYLSLSYLFTTYYFCYGTTLSYFDFIEKNDVFFLYFLILTFLGCFALVDPIFYTFSFALTLTVLLSLCQQIRPLVFSNFGYALTFFALGVFSSWQVYVYQINHVRSEEILTRYSNLDSLTGLYNRRKLEEDLKKEEGTSTYLFLMSDLNDFKHINDSKGHAYGDEVLKQCSKLLLASFPNEAYRYGGDEFTILSKEKDPQVVTEKLEAINAKLRSLYPDGSVELSFGFVFETASNLEERLEALHKADVALYEAKKEKGHIQEGE